MPPIGIRQNNPGNIRISRTPWVGLLPVQPGDQYCRFATAEDGLSAIAKCLHTYEAADKLTTIRGWISRWAPRKDRNNTAKYIANVAAAAAVGPDAPVSAADRAFMARVMRAIVRQENTQDPYTDEQVEKALDLAGLPPCGAAAAQAA